MEIAIMAIVTANPIGNVPDDDDGSVSVSVGSELGSGEEVV